MKKPASRGGETGLSTASGRDTSERYNPNLHLVQLEPISVGAELLPAVAGDRLGQPWRTGAARRAFTPRQETQQHDMARHCRDQDRGRLTTAERSFVWKIGHLRGALTIRQGDWLADITDRLEWEDRHACR